MPAAEAPLKRLVVDRGNQPLSTGDYVRFSPPIGGQAIGRIASIDPTNCMLRVTWIADIEGWRIDPVLSWTTQLLMSQLDARPEAAP